MRPFLLALALLAATAHADQNNWRLPQLFERLKAPINAGEAQQIESTIWQIWLRSENEDSNIRMRAGIHAMNAGDYPAALKAFDAMVADDPEFAEGWNKRATVHYLMDSYDASVRDIERTLALEPRHFGALSGLGLINLELGNDRVALRAFEAVLAVNPHSPSAREHVRVLRQKLLGSPT
ncbi:MAG: tetratricopeptide repeat protein [Alphaproteobacteria bacterium]|nr:tetratricopeptide repeat protein [Alphaproteobacteria bacterium]